MSYIGTTEIGKMFLGTTEIDKAYLGGDLVFDSGGTPLPYTQITYIQGDGVAYINTGIKGNVTKSFELYIVPKLPSSGNSYVMGCRKDSGNTRFIPLMFNANGCAGYAYAGSVYNSSSSGVDCSASASNKTPMYVRCSLAKNSQYFGIKQNGDSSYTTRHTTLSSSISTNLDMLVFAANFYGTISVANSGTRLYHLKIWGNADYTGLLFDGFACTYNGEYGLWDNVSNSFFGNAASSGAFTGQ